MTIELKMALLLGAIGSLWIPFVTKFDGKDELFVRPPDDSKMPLRSLAAANRRPPQTPAANSRAPAANPAPAWPSRSSPPEPGSS